jgi:hypothetical protein
MANLESLSPFRTNETGPSNAPLPKVDLYIDPIEATGGISSTVDHWGEAALKHPITKIFEQISIANGAPAPLPTDWEGIAGEFSADSQMAVFANPNTADVSHIMDMSDETLTQVMDRITEEQASRVPEEKAKEPRALPSIPRYVPQAITITAGAAGIVAGANVIDAAPAQAAGFVATGSGGANCVIPKAEIDKLINEKGLAYYAYRPTGDSSLRDPNQIPGTSADAQANPLKLRDCVDSSAANPEWPYKTPEAAMNAWNSGKIKIKPTDRWFTSDAHPQAYGNPGVENMAKEPLFGYQAMLLNVSVVDGDEVEILVGMEGRIKPGSPNNEKGYLNRDRFTALIRISCGIDYPAELQEVSNLDSHEFSDIGSGIIRGETARDVARKLTGKEGSNIVFYVENTYTGDWENPPNKRLDAVRQITEPAREFYTASWEAFNGKRVAGLRNKTNINKAPGEVKPDQLPLTTYLFIKK